MNIASSPLGGKFYETKSRNANSRKRIQPAVMPLGYAQFLFISTFLIDFSSSDEFRLVFTHVLYRHGDRSPSGTFPNDEHQEDAWPAKWGQLTPKGVKEQQELGSYLRQRYESFLSAEYDRDEIYIRSSDVDRALESAESNLAGLYPIPVDQQGCDALMGRRPIPIHSAPKEMDQLLQTEADENCPTYKRIYEEQGAQYIQEMNDKYSELFAFLMEKTGLAELNFQNIGDVYSPLSREKLYGLEVPEWVDQVWDETSGETVYEIVDMLRMNIRFLKFNTPEKARLMSGYLVGDILKRMNDKASGKLKRPSKMVMYSAHDGTILGLLFAMDVMNGLRVPYAACVIIELHESISDPSEHFVAIYYRNDTTHDPFPLISPGCREAAVDDVYCPLGVFEESVKAAVLYPLDEVKKACGTDVCTNVAAPSSEANQNPNSSDDSPSNGEQSESAETQ